MRIQPWIKAVTGALLLLSVEATTSGQGPYYEPPMPAGAPGYYAPPPAYGAAGLQPPAAQGYYPPASAPGGSADPSLIYPPGNPAEYQPWPTISPFMSPNVGQDTHYNQDGLWLRKLLYRQRDYYFSMEGMAVRFRSAGDSIIGSNYAALSSFQVNNVLGGPQDPSTGPFVDIDVPNVDGDFSGFYPVDPNIYPFPLLSDNDSLLTANANADKFPILTANAMGATDIAGGLQMRWGFNNEDYTGMMANAWWAFEQDAHYSRGHEFINGVRVTQAITQALGGQNLTPLNGNIPLYNGEFLVPNFGAGSTAKYDVLYSMKFTTEAGGTNLSFYQQPLYKHRNVMVRPLWGLRYMYIAEGFQFRGIDSGFNYDIDEDTNRPDTNNPERLYDQYEANLRNDIQTHIAGPEVGLRFDLGNPREGFKIWGETIFGLNVNNERIHLRGDNIGDPLRDVRFNGFLIPRILDDANFDSRFDSRKTNTHVSPLFQQSIFADFNILETIPVIKNMSVFDDATFRVGYTYLWVGEVARPTESINWQGFPLKPEIQTDRQSWWAHQLNLAIDWRY